MPPCSGAIASVLACLLAATPLARALSETGAETITGSRPDASARHAVLRLEGDLDARATADAFIGALDDLDARAPRLILIELTGDRSRPDLLHDAVRAVMDTETETAVWLADPDDRRVGPGMLALALAADHAGVHPSTTIERAPDDDLTGLNPEIEDWAVVGLDLRSLARDLADAGPLARGVYESALAPRSSLWIVSDQNGAPALSPEAPARGTPLVERTRAGWSFEIDAPGAGRLYGIAQHRSARAFARTLGARARPLEPVTIESGLARSHGRCLELVARVREAVRLAESALDVRAGRNGTARTLPHEYHDAADAAAALVAPSRAAIAEIAALTDRFAEILQMPPPPDDDAPTEIGGPDTARLTAWRAAVRDLEYDLSRLDTRIASYRRR